MKRITFAACALASVLLLFAGCTDSTPDNSQNGTETDTGIVSDGSNVEAKTVSPLPSGIDIENLDNCTVAVSFDKGDAYVDDEGAMQLKFKAYVYDVYDTVDVASLQAGDKIEICKQEVAVTSLERSENGTVIINGGTENGGYELTSDEDTVFYVKGADDGKQYYELGETTVKVSVDFEFDDLSKAESGAVKYYPGDFLVDDSGIEYNFVPNNTTITIQDGYVVSMQRN